MLCPNCGVNVGESPTLCLKCRELAQELEPTTDSNSSEPQDVIPSSSIGKQGNQISSLMLTSIIAILVLIVISINMLISKSRPAVVLTPAQRAELDLDYKRCMAIFQGSLKMQKEISQKVGGTAGYLSSAFSSYALSAGALEKQCREMNEFCEQDYTGSQCQMSRQLNKVFFVIQKVCEQNGLKSMSSPECQELSKYCIAEGIHGEQCEMLLKRHGV